MAIDFTLAPEHEEIRDRVRAFVDDASSRPSSRSDRATTWSATCDGATSATCSPCADGAREQGLWLPHMPQEWGGMGLGHVALAMVQAEAAKTRVGPWVLNCLAPDEGNMHTLLHWGDRRAEGEVPEAAVRGRHDRRASR